MKLLDLNYRSGKELLAELDPDHFITSKKRVVSKLEAQTNWAKPIEAIMATEHLELSDEEYAELTADWLRWQEFLSSNVEKHMTGKHDQKTHGRGGGGVHDAPARMAFWNRSTDAKEAKASVTADLAGRMRKAGVTDEQFASAFDDIVRKPNALLSKAGQPAITKFEGMKVADNITLVTQSDPNDASSISVTRLSDAQRNFPELAAQAGITIDPAEPFFRADYEQTTKFVELLNAELGASKGFEVYAVGDSTAGKRMLSDSVTSSLIANWAGTSNDASALSLTIQERAASLFKLEETADWKISPDTQSKITTINNSHAPLIDSFLGAQYEATQADFKKQGITEVTLWRGVALDNSDNLSSVSLFKASHQSRPLTSWSTDIGTATIFARSQSYQNGKFGVVIKHVYPVERVLGTPFTGVGCLAEKEFVMLGGKDNVNGIYHEYSSELMDD